MADPQSNGTVIGPDTVIKGEMSVENRARILGRFEGTIRAKGQIEIADKATCQANVEASTIQIDGGMEGNITASDKVQLNATARLHGDVVAAKLVVAEGASLMGHVQIGPDALKRGAGAGGAGGGGGSPEARGAGGAGGGGQQAGQAQKK